MVKGNAIVGQSGGPTVVINESLVGLIESLSGRPEIGRLFGARFGVKGILEEKFVDLFTYPKETIHALAKTPGAGLGSVRKKPSEEECLRMFEIMKKHEIRYFFYIGGNDSAETAYIVSSVAKKAGYELICIHIPKTIDNDLKVTDHCPGYGSAAKFVAMAFIGDDLDNRSLPGVKINIIMGRHAGFLTAASALARKHEDDGPHLIYVPEKPITREQFRDDVARVYEKLGRCVVAVSEGIVDAMLDPHKTFAEEIKQEIISLTETIDKGASNIDPKSFDVVRLLAGIEKDQFGNIQLSGSGMLGDWLAGYVRRELGKKVRVRADTFGYMQRSFPGIRSEVDAEEARMCGRMAGDMAIRGEEGSVIIVRHPADSYSVQFSKTELLNVARTTKTMPPEFIAPSGNDVTSEFISYARPLVGSLPDICLL